MSKSNLFELKNTSEFLKLLDDPNKIVVLDFHAGWCGPCIKLGKVLHELVVKEGKYPTVTFAKADTGLTAKVTMEDGTVNEIIVFEDLLKKFKVNGIPRVLVFKGKELKKDITGYNPTLLIETLDLDKLLEN
jgi:thiol-disulfide isomerase/thioredoxin